MLFDPFVQTVWEYLLLPLRCRRFFFHFRNLFSTCDTNEHWHVYVTRCKLRQFRCISYTLLLLLHMWYKCTYTMFQPPKIHWIAPFLSVAILAEAVVLRTRASGACMWSGGIRAVAPCQKLGLEVAIQERKLITNAAVWRVMERSGECERTSAVLGC